MARREQIDDAPAQRNFWTDDREINVLARGDGKKRVGFRRITSDTASDRCDARVARCTDDVGYGALARQLPRKRMLPGTTADDENLHEEGR